MSLVSDGFLPFRDNVDHAVRHGVRFIAQPGGSTRDDEVNDACREYGISSATYYKWKSKYGGMSASDLKRMKEMERELGQYKRMYAELAHENFALKDLIDRKL